MARIRRDEAWPFLLSREDWVQAEIDEANGSGNASIFYNCQLRKLEALGFSAERGTPKQLTATATASKAVPLAFWVLNSISLLIGAGLDYKSSVQIILWLCQYGQAGRDRSDQRKQHMEELIASFGLPTFTCSTETFFNRVLPTAHIAAQAIKYSAKHARLFGQFLNFAPRDIAAFDTPARREPLWEKQWLDRAVANLGKRFRMDEKTAVELVLAFCICCQGEMRKSTNGSKGVKYETQRVLNQLGMPLDEPSPRKYEALLAAINPVAFERHRSFNI